MKISFKNDDNEYQTSVDNNDAVAPNIGQYSRALGQNCLLCGL